MQKSSQGSEQIRYKADDATLAIIAQDDNLGKELCTSVSFHELLGEHIRLAKYTSKRAFARAAGINHETLRKYVKGERLPSNEALSKLILCLGLVGSPSGARLTRALVEARGSRPTQGKRSYGVSATAELTDTTGLTTDARLKQKVDALVDVFFANANRERTPEMEYVLTTTYRNILSDGGEK